MHKMILVADLHLGISQDNSLWHEASLRLAEDIHDNAIKHDIGTIAVLGDIFDNRKFITQKTYNIARQMILDIWKDFTVILVRGNHDTYYKNISTPHWLELFGGQSNVVLVDSEPYTTHGCCFVPWEYDISTISSNCILMGHFEINSFYMNTTHQCKTSTLNIKDFNRFKTVYSGHFHFPQTYGNITYIGSPMQQNFGDVGSSRGYYILDDNGINFIQFTKAPNFVIIRTNEDILPEQVNGNIVKLIFDKDYGTRKNNEIVERIDLMGPAVLAGIDTTNFCTENVQMSKDDNEEIIIKDNVALLFDYINACETPEHLKRKTILKMVDMLMKEAYNEY